MDIELSAIKLLLEEAAESKDAALEHFSEMKPCFFGSEASVILGGITSYYNGNFEVPDFNQLNVLIRDTARTEALAALELLEVPASVDIDLLIVALQDTFVQNHTLDHVDTLLDKISTLSSEEVKEEIGSLALSLEDLTNNDGTVYTSADLSVFDSDELSSRTYLGLNNDFDNSTGGIAPTELVLVGGYRGSGKSLICSNICDNQVSQGNATIYFSIEMRAREVLLRHLAMRANINHTQLKLNQLDRPSLERLAKVRSEMFQGSDELYAQYMGEQITYEQFDARVVKLPLSDNQLIIVDNQTLTLADIDINIQKQKSRHGDRLKMVIVDYINQIAIRDQYDWRSQIEISKGLKNIAVKHNVSIISPYQIDKSGEARMSKGILDAADLAIILSKEESLIKFDITKVRGGAAVESTSTMDWSTLKINPTPVSTAEVEDQSLESSVEI